MSSEYTSKSSNEELANVKKIMDIVECIPEAAWPILLNSKPNSNGRFSLNSHEYHDDHEILAEVAELLFIGSMTRWLVERGSEIIPMEGRIGVRHKELVAGASSPLIASRWSTGDTLLTALASATRAVGRGE